MQISEDFSSANYVLTGYHVGEFMINGASYQKSLIISPNYLIRDWEPESLLDLRAHHWDCILQQPIDLILLGTGWRFVWPSPESLQPLQTHNIAIECMTTPAACRTYVALAAEGRRVAAALLLDMGDANKGKE